MVGGRARWQMIGSQQLQSRGRIIPSLTLLQQTISTIAPWQRCRIVFGFWRALRQFPLVLSYSWRKAAGKVSSRSCSSTGRISRPAKALEFEVVYREYLLGLHNLQQHLNRCERRYGRGAGLACPHR